MEMGVVESGKREAASGIDDDGLLVCQRGDVVI
jgi:hypothetical protein